MGSGRLAEGNPWIVYLNHFGVQVTPLILAISWERGLVKAMQRVKRGRGDVWAAEVVALYENLGC